MGKSKGREQLTLDQVGELWQINKSMTRKTGAGIGSRIQGVIRELTAGGTEATGLDAQRRSWEDFYREYLGMECDFSDVVIPEKQDGFDRLVIIAAGLLMQQAYDDCKEFFPCWKWTDGSLDEAVPTNDRDPQDGAYAVWFRDRVEADEELASVSADQLRERGVTCVTLLERLVLELRYFSETGEHLDRETVTLCAGSRGRGGRVVPDVRLHDGKLSVLWSCSDNASYSCLRARQGVSLP